MKLKICVVLLLIVSALLAQTKNEFPIHKQAFQVSYLLDSDPDLEELVFFSYKKHIRNNNAHKISINVFYDLNKTEDKKRLIETTILNNGFSFSYSFLHYLEFEKKHNIYYGIGLMGKCSYQENEENEDHDSYYRITTDYQKKWSPNISPCFGFELAFSKKISLTLENSLIFGYSNELQKKTSKSHDSSIIHSYQRNENYYFKPVNINIGINYYF